MANGEEKNGNEFQQRERAKGLLRNKLGVR